MKYCELDPYKICDNCNKCNMCDLDPTKLCDNCGKCLGLNDRDYAKIIIDKVIVDDNK